MSEREESALPSAATNDLAKVRAVLLRELRAQPAPRRWWIDAGGLVVFQIAVASFVVVAWSLLAAARITVGWPSAVLAAALLAATIAAVRPGGGRGSAGASLVVVGGAAIAASVGASAHPHLVTIVGDVDCAFAEIGASALPAVAALVVLRRFSFSPRSAFLGGLAAGSTGVLALDLTCPIATFGHVIAFHLAPCVAVAVAFTAVRSRMRSRSFAP